MVSTQRVPGVALVVDVDETVLRSCASMLRAAGMQVVTASTSADALDALGVNKNVSLPDSDGPDLLRAIRAKDTDLPVIFVTTWPDFSPSNLAEQVDKGGPNTAEALRGTVVSAAVSYRIGRRARRASTLPGGEG
jgi:FixJ family two-component response regulator